MSAREKIAYLKGLIDGLGPAGDEGQGRIFAAIVDALDALSAEVVEHGELIEEQRELYEDLSDDCALLDEDLDALEKAFAECSGESDFDEDEDEDEEVTAPEIDQGGDEPILTPDDDDDDASDDAGLKISDGDDDDDDISDDDDDSVPFIEDEDDDSIDEEITKSAKKDDD